MTLPKKGIDMIRRSYPYPFHHPNSCTCVQCEHVNRVIDSQHDDHTDYVEPTERQDDEEGNRPGN